jgi:hypothetical protein
MEGFKKEMRLVATIDVSRGKVKCRTSKSTMGTDSNDSLNT